MVLHLEVVKINEYNEYILKDKNNNKEYRLILEFYGINKPNINDIIVISNKLLEPNNKWYSQPYAFELTDDTNINLKSVNLIGFISKDKKYILKRIYG